ncbi:MAG: M3 family metallopeptidase [Rhizobiaceae bacterium]
MPTDEFDPSTTNPSLTDWKGPYGLPDFPSIGDGDFSAAFDEALKAHSAEIGAIADNPEAPTIANTLQALELSGEALSRVASIFWCKAGADTNDVIQALERDIAPRMARHYTAIGLNEKLFARIDTLHGSRGQLNLDAETVRALEKSWKGFVRAGANLKGKARKRFAEIREELASLGITFGQNVLADESEWQLILDEADLQGLPEFLRESMSAAAESRGHEGKFVVTLSRSIAEPFLAFSERRDLRETVHKAFVERGENKNWPVIEKTLRLRVELAKLLGYETFAAFKLDNTMAKTPDAVMKLLEPVWERAKASAAEDQADMAQIAASEGHNHDIAAWDWRRYAEKLKTSKFDFDEAELKPYLKLENVLEASFAVATKLFGLEFRELEGTQAWHPDVRTFEVINRDGSHRGLFLADYFARSSKRSGAWMSALQSSHRLGEGEKPIIYNICNFAKPAKGQPALLSLDEANTVFHEFGHALHGLLSEATWPSLSGTSVSRDFVELPSQLYEHWLTTPEILSAYARHFETGEPMPDALREKLLAAKTFNAGFNTVEFTASALMDMVYHGSEVLPENPQAFEVETLVKLDMPDAIAMRHRSPHFLHVFAGDGYSAGYYSYMWSEVLDADAFAAFEETGDVFSAETAGKLLKHIYSAGDTADPEELYLSFRGKMPTAEAMMEKRGLNEPVTA